MLKDNGRTAPAGTEEKANLKGKKMYCAKCNVHHVVASSVFGNDVCEVCGEKLSDSDMATASKTTGR